MSSNLKIAEVSGSFQHLRNDGLLWRVRSDWTEAFSNGQTPLWHALKDDPSATLIKQNPARQIWRIGWGEHIVYCKVYRTTTLINWVRERFRELFRGSSATREFKRLQSAKVHGFTAPSPIACGRRTNGTGYLITDAIEPAQSTVEFLLDSPPAKRIHAITRQFSEMLARLHSAGMDHRDLHLENILLMDSNGKLVLLDWFEVRNRNMNLQNSIEALARWKAAAAEWTSKTNQYRFISTYAARRGWQHLLDHLLTQIERRSRSLLSFQREQRMRRANRNGRLAQSIVLPDGWRGRVWLQAKPAPRPTPTGNMQFTIQDWREAMGDPDNYYDRDAAGVVKSGSKAITRRDVLQLGNQNVTVFVKATHQNQLDLWFGRFRASRSSRSWRVGHWLLINGIFAPRPLAALQRRQAGIRRGDLLISEAIEPAERLSWFIHHTLVQQRGTQRWRTISYLAATLVDLLADLHRCDIIHRDCKMPNLLVQWPNPSQCRIYLVDLDGVSLRRWWQPRRPLSPLRRLARSALPSRHALSRTDFLRVLRAFLQRIDADSKSWKNHWRQIAQTMPHE